MVAASIYLGVCTNFFLTKLKSYRLLAFRRTSRLQKGYMSGCLLQSSHSSWIPIFAHMWLSSRNQMVLTIYCEFQWTVQHINGWCKSCFLLNFEWYRCLTFRRTNRLHRRLPCLSLHSNPPNPPVCVHERSSRNQMSQLTAEISLNSDKILKASLRGYRILN